MASIIALTARVMGPPVRAGRKRSDASIGDRLRARIAEKTTAAATDTASSTKSLPVKPGMNIRGAKTETRTTVVATTAKNT